MRPVLGAGHPDRMDPTSVTRELGGVARTAELLTVCSHREIVRAVAAGRLVKVARGRYALPHARRALREAARLSGTVSHLSAAQVHGWEVARVPELPWVAVPRNRKVSATDRTAANVVYSTATGHVTDPIRTVLDCARKLDLGEGLTVADSALRHRAVDQEELVAAAATMRGPGAGRCRRVAREATPLAANPLESMLRAIALDVPGLSVAPQVAVELPGFVVHPDLVDEALGLVIEAEGFVYHGATPLRFDRDVERYTRLVLTGRLVVRFTRQHVMEEAEFVRQSLTTLVALRGPRLAA